MGREILIIVGFVVMGLGTAAGVLVVLSGFISSLFGDPLAAGPMMMFAIATVLVGVLIGGLLVYAGNRSRSHGSGGSARDPPP